MNEEMKKFEKLLKEVVEKRISGKVTISTITKPGEHYEGLTIAVPGETVAPVIRLEPYAEMHDYGLGINEIANRVIADYEEYCKNRPNLNDINLLTNFEYVKNMIMPSLINAEINKKLLKTAPYRVLHDLAITYRIVLSFDKNGTKSVLITKPFMDAMGVSEDDLYEAAKENLAKAEKTCLSVTEVCAPFLSSTIRESIDGFLNVIAVKDYYYGASVILDSKTLTKIYKKIGAFTLIPSSVSEFLIAPTVLQADGVNSMITEVNKTLEPTEVLSDHAYAVVGSTEGLRIISID